jgi:hypothetical protein
MNEIEKIIQNKAFYIAQKKAAIKYADSVNYTAKCFDKDNEAKEIVFAQPEELTEVDKIRVKSVINTTGLMDSHNDVHIKGLWNKSLRETKNFYLLNGHKMSFDSVISDDVKAMAQDMFWGDLGFEYSGNTQALIFNSKIAKEDNPYMFEKYLKGKVKNHSVGMRYVKIYLAANNPKYKEEYDIWEKYISEVSNRDTAEEKGYFWAVTEAKILEGSAVLMGSNWATPTLDVSAAKGTGIIEEPINITLSKAEVLTYLKDNFKI